MSEHILEPKIDRMWHELYYDKEADPTDKRTDKQFCEELGLNPGSFATWKHKFRTFIYREVEARRKTFRNEMRTLGYKALMRKLETGDTNAIKLHFQLLGDLVEKIETKTENMNDADKKRRIESLRRETTEREESWDKAKRKDGSVES